MSGFDSERLQLALPGVTSLLFAGSALYIGFIDPCVREAHRDEKSQLVHWSAMYNHSKVPMASLAALSAIFGINAHRLTKQPLWLYGSAAAFAIIPFTFLAIMGINKNLADIESKSKYGTDVTKGVADKLCDWVWRHRVRAILALVAAGLFYVADARTPVIIIKQPVAI